MNWQNYAHEVDRATYDPADDKIRIYSGRVSRELYDALKALGFGRAPVQGCFFQVWSPGREDAALGLCGGIDDEDSTLFDRADERGTRFAVYSEHADQRADAAFDAAHKMSERFAGGQPILVGHHSERKARKDHDRVDRLASKAVEEYDRRDYWARRATAVKRNAEYTFDRNVIMRRVKKLEADKRKHEKDRDEASMFLKMWNVADLTLEKARAIANYDHVSVKYTLDKYPRDHNLYEGYRSVWDGLVDNIIDVTEAKRLTVDCHERSIRTDQRWIDHLEGEISYWRAVLENEHDTDIDIQFPIKKGHWVRDAVGWIQVQRVNRGAEKRITSVSIIPRPGTWSWCKTIEYERIKEWSAIEPEQKGVAPREIAFAIQQPDPDKERARELAQVISRAEIAVNWDEDYFPTPPDAVIRMVDLLGLMPYSLVILEPSAGDGRLVDEVRKRGNQYAIECVEPNHVARKTLEAKGYKLVGSDFLEYWLPADDDNKPMFMYDRIVMNPPWGRRQWVRHIQHAWNLLRPGGRIVALLPAGAVYEDLGEIYTHLHVNGDLVSGFEGTNVRGAVVVIDKQSEFSASGRLF